MAALTADRVVVELQAKVDAYNRNVDAARNRFDQNMDRIARSAGLAEGRVASAGRGMATALSAISRAAGPAGVVMAGTIGIVASMSREIAALGENARKTQLDVSRFQQLRLGAQSVGIEGKTFDTGMSGLAKELNEAKRQETDLTRLLDANNIKYRDRRGQIIGTNEALRIAAELIGKAREEQDRIEIAKRFGLPEEFVRLLERGASGLEKIAAEASKAGTVLDEEVIKKASDFDRAWSNGWSNFGINAKAAIYSAAKGILDLIQQAANIKITVGASDLPPDLQKRAEAQAEDRRRKREAANAQIREEPAAVRAIRSEAAREAMSRHTDMDVAGSTEAASRQVKAQLPPTRPTDLDPKIPKSGKPAAGAKGPKSEEDKAQESLDRYIESLMRQNSVLDAEIATFGKSNAEKRAAVELAKAQVDLAKLDEPARQKVIEGLKQEIELSEQKRQQLQKLKEAQDGLRDAQRYFGDAAVDALEDLIINGEKAEKVVANLAKSLAKAALQAALMGTGPLAGLFGTAGSNGNIGGLFGSLFSRGGGLTPGSGGLYAGGGYTGPGGKYQPAGVVHKGEVVWSQDDVKRAGGVGVVEGMRRGLSGFANGGPVAMPVLPTPRAAAAGEARGGSDRRVFNIDARGAQQGVAEQIVAAIKAYDARFDRRLAEARSQSARRAGVY